MAHWTMDLNKYADKQNIAIKDVQKAYTFALYSSIVKKTPVDTGRARGNWQVTVGRPATEAIEDKRKNPLPMSKMPVPKGDESVFIANNLDYIEKLEYGTYPNPPKKGTWVKNKNGKGGHYEKRSENGFSRQAPEGMVGVTLANNENIFNAAVRSVKK